jgi:DedD protein
MDPALKKRMIGAAILIVLAIIFVPMLFTGRPSERTETVDLNLPKTPDRDFTTRTIPLDPAPKPAPQSGDALATVDTEKERDKAPPATPEPAPQPAQPQPAAAPAAKQPEPAAPAAETSQGNSQHGRWAVSYGTYGKVENADKLVADLKKAGIAAYGEPVAVKDGMGVRVRSGPYVDKSQAEKARLSARTARADVTGKLVELDETTAPVAPPAKPAAPAATPAAPTAATSAPPATDAAPHAATTGATSVTGWAVQVGAYQSERDASGRRDALRNAGFSAYVEPVKTAKGTLYRVRVGPTAERAGADKLRAELKEKMKLDGTVVQEP